jgi:hypothetical protein
MTGTGGTWSAPPSIVMASPVVGGIRFVYVGMENDGRMARGRVVAREV